MELLLSKATNLTKIYHISFQNNFLAFFTYKISFY